MSQQQVDGNVTKSTVADKPGTSPAPTQRRRTPMSTPRRKLEVMQEIPGHHMHWFRDDKIAQALDAGYTKVMRSEVSLNINNPGMKPGSDGNTALDSSVSIVGGKTDDGDPIGLTLMKIPEEYFLEDQKVLENHNIQKMQSIFENEMIVGKDGRMSKDATAYVKTALFNRPKRVAKLGRRPSPFSTSS